MKSTRQQLKKIPNVPCLYRHEKTGEYYGIKKVRGKIKTSCFGTSDRKLAEKKLDSWEKEQEIASGGEILLFELCAKWLSGHGSKKPKTIEGYNTAIKRLLEFFPSNILVNKIKVSELREFLSEMSKRYSPSSFNHISEAVNSIFQTALNDYYISENPFDKIDKKLKWQRIIRKKPKSPELEEFYQIVNHIRTQRWSDTREEASDLAEFMGLAALGTAECYALKWEDFNWKEKEINLTRIKTSKEFIIPFYPWLEPFIKKLYEKRGKPKTGQVFAVRCIKESLKNACQKLKLPRFSPRNLRQMGIKRLLRGGYPPKLIALAQGHKDESLILKVYSETVSSGEKEYRKIELERLRKKEIEIV